VPFPSFSFGPGRPTLAASTRYWIGVWAGNTVNSGQINMGSVNTGSVANAYFVTGQTYSSTSSPSVSSWNSVGFPWLYNIYAFYLPSGSTAYLKSGFGKENG